MNPIANNGDSNGRFHARLHQAAGMVSVQMGCSITDAMIAILRLSEETDETLESIADHVINQVIRFDS